MIIISSDSTCDLGVLFKERNVPTLPLAVVLGGESYEDGVTVTPDKIYEFVDKNGILPKTAARRGRASRVFCRTKKERRRQHSALLHIRRYFRPLP